MNSSHEEDGKILATRNAIMGDVCWEIHAAALEIETIPGALDPKEEGNTVLRTAQHDLNAHRRVLRKLLRLLEQLPRELEVLLVADEEKREEQQDKNIYVKQSVDLANENGSHRGNEASPPQDEEEIMNDSKPKSDTASFIIQQTQNSFSQPSNDYTMEDNNNGKGERGVIPLELQEDLLLLLAELRLPEDNDAIRDLVESCTETISEVWLCYFPHMPLGQAVLPLLGKVLYSNSVRASFAQIKVLNAFFMSAAASWDNEPCVIVIALSNFFLRAEIPFEVHQLCTFLLEALVRCYDQHNDEEEWDSWLDWQCQQADTSVDTFVSSVTQWAMHLTDEALDALDLASDNCWLLGDIAVHVLVSAVRFNAVLDQSANRMWKTVASFGWDQAVNSNDTHRNDYLIAKLSVDLAAVAMASIKTDSRTPTIAFFRALPFPELLMESTWWSAVPKADLQSGVLSLLQDQHNQQSSDLAKQILDHVPPLEDENIISWDMYFWHQVEAHGFELHTSAE